MSDEGISYCWLARWRNVSCIVSPPLSSLQRRGRASHLNLYHLISSRRHSVCYQTLGEELFYGVYRHHLFPLWHVHHLHGYDFKTIMTMMVTMTITMTIMIIVIIIPSFHNTVMVTINEEVITGCDSAESKCVVLRMTNTILRFPCIEILPF